MLNSLVFTPRLTTDDVISRARRCVHQFPLVTDVAHPVRLEPVRRSRRSVGEKMSIKVFYHSSLEDLQQERRSVLVDRIVPEAVKYWEDIITVVNPVTNIKLNRRCRNNQYFLSPGETTQYCKGRCKHKMIGTFQLKDNYFFYSPKPPPQLYWRIPLIDVF